MSGMLVNGPHPRQGVGPDENAVVKVAMYTIRKLQYLIAECNLFQSHLLYASWHDAWRIVLAFLPDKLPSFFNVTWKKNDRGQWKITNTPKWEALKDTMDKEICGVFWISVSMLATSACFLLVNWRGWLNSVCLEAFLQWSHGDLPMQYLKKTLSNVGSVATLASTPAPASPAAASTNPGDQTADVTDLLGMEPPAKAMPKHKARPASIGPVRGATATAPPLIPDVGALVQPPIPMQFNMNPPLRRAVDILAPPEEFHMTQVPVRLPMQFYEATQNTWWSHVRRDSLQGAMLHQPWWACLWDARCFSTFLVPQSLYRWIEEEWYAEHSVCL